MVSDAEKEAFHSDGYVHLRKVLAEAELVDIERVYERFLHGKIAVPGKDLNDMTTGEHGTDPSGYAVVNVMVPRRYHTAGQGNLFERRAASIAEQLCGEVMRYVPIRRGDITVHGEGVLHGSGGNTSKDSWRRAYIVAFRSDGTVHAERARGFTHSHNDDVAVLEQVDGLALEAKIRVR